MELISIEQGTPEWLELRRTKRTASETPAIMRASPWGSWETIKKAKLGERGFVNKAMKYGQEMEGEARRAYFLAHGDFFEPCVAIEGEYLASLDGYGEGEILEIKSPYSKRESPTWKHAEQGIIEPHYRWQLQHQLMVTGAEIAHFWVFDGSVGIRLAERPEPEMWAQFRREWDRFTHWMATGEGAPENEEVPDLSGDPLVSALAREFAERKAASDAADAMLDDVRARLLAATTDYSALRASGVLVTRYTKKGNVQYAKIPLLKGVDLEPYRAKESEAIKITVEK